MKKHEKLFKSFIKYKIMRRIYITQRKCLKYLFSFTLFSFQPSVYSFYHYNQLLLNINIIFTIWLILLVINIIISSIILQILLCCLTMCLLNPSVHYGTWYAMTWIAFGEVPLRGSPTNDGREREKKQLTDKPYYTSWLTTYISLYI